MKKILYILLMLSLIMSCGTQKNTVTKKEAENKNEVVEEKKNEIKTLKIGDTIKNSKAEITIKKIEFSYDVLPDDTSGFYTHYPAESGNVYIHVDTDVKNIQKQQLGADEIMTVTADYNGGYTYSAEPIPEDSQTGFTYANITAIDPLKTLGVRYLLSVPQEVEETQNPLKLIFEIEGEKYEYTMR
ncbi:Uncharacterised protein [Sebaldella termitidis]|uniref:Lipoprotein n=1 Tax=Sebaldella termitidis (strain ATCC 33386 / NCTC 11300) TaxID=526218 RepID=D1AN83_SEBTE|nr:hypothetical protein [Sebaldella termitidis]ACZ09687.1 hypothetical protein Sterm_2843 [Sebaldella termitidis ATCC 33386]SUI25019.1 Uncharacterised protein [Sebaldella termitidis]